MTGSARFAEERTLVKKEKREVIRIQRGEREEPRALS
jgi:hypothetical protein